MHIAVNSKSMRNRHLGGAACFCFVCQTHFEALVPCLHVPAFFTVLLNFFVISSFFISLSSPKTTEYHPFPLKPTKLTHFHTGEVRHKELTGS